MPVLLKATKAISDRLPKVISPGAHAALDYAQAGTFLLAGMLWWKRHRPAAISACICGGSKLLVAGMRRYPGTPETEFSAHGRVEIGLALLTEMLPRFMNFGREPQSRFFSAQAITTAAIAGLTDFNGSGETGQLRRVRMAA